LNRIFDLVTFSFFSKPHKPLLNVAEFTVNLIFPKRVHSSIGLPEMWLGAISVSHCQKQSHRDWVAVGPRLNAGVPHAHVSEHAQSHAGLMRYPCEGAHAMLSR